MRRCSSWPVPSIGEFVNCCLENANVTQGHHKAGQWRACRPARASSQRLRSSCIPRPIRTIAQWRSSRAFSLAAVCAAAIATAHAQELRIVVEQPASATAQPAAEPDKQGAQTNMNPGSSDHRSPDPAHTTHKAAHAAPVQVNPIVALARKRLAQGARGDEFDRADRDALKAHYAEPGRTPMWVAGGELSRRAKDVMAEIGRAEEWGLSSAAFELPDAKSARVSPAALAEAEFKLGLAVLKYARHARGGRVDPMQTGQSGDHRPTLVAPKAVLSAIGNAEKPDGYLRGLHPKHPQVRRPCARSSPSSFQRPHDAPARACAYCGDICVDGLRRRPTN